LDGAGHEGLGCDNGGVGSKNAPLSVGERGGAGGGRLESEVGVEAVFHCDSDGV